MTIFSMSLSYGGNGDLARRNALALNLLVQQPHLQWNVESSSSSPATEDEVTKKLEKLLAQYWFYLLANLI